MTYRSPQEQEALEHEITARYDYVAEKFASEFGTCPVCGARTIDPFGCCYEPEPDPQAAVPSHCATLPQDAIYRRGQAVAPTTTDDDIPF